jgi:hypothetical protein
VFNVLFVGYSLAKDNLNNAYQYNIIPKKISKTIQYNQRNSFSRGFPLPFNVETLQAFGALFQIPQYYRKFLYYKTKMLRDYLIILIKFKVCRFLCRSVYYLFLNIYLFLKFLMITMLTIK